MRPYLIVMALAAGAAAPARAADCASLGRLVLPRAAVTATTQIPAGGTLAGVDVKLPFAVCKVEATARPSADSDVRLAVLMPAAAAWNGKFLQFGNGAFAGQIPYSAMLLGLTRGYAVAGTDDGHQTADGSDASWALGHPEKVVDFGWRAVKATTDAAKAIVAAYAGLPRRNYFFGCSDGGREALMTAQRFPADFDGIIAGAPAWNWTRLMGASALAQQTLLKPAAALPPAKLAALQAAALEACGGGRHYIAAPAACRFDPGVLACKGAETDACLTPGQLATVRRIYRGEIDPVDGARLPGRAPGAEALPGSWGAWTLALEPGRADAAARSGIPWNHFAYLVKADPGLDLRRLTRADVVAGDRQWAATLNAASPDLAAFKARGGKLIGYHGWNDPAIPPGLSLDYLRRVQAKMGPTADFYRLFMVPGMLHCRGGDAPTQVDWFALLDGWVDGGKAPGAVVAHGGDGAVQTVAAEP